MIHIYKYNRNGIQCCYCKINKLDCIEYLYIYLTYNLVDTIYYIKIM